MQGKTRRAVLSPAKGLDAAASSQIAADVAKELNMDPDAIMSQLEKLCIEKGMRMTEQRRTIARALSAADDHPDAEELHRRANKLDASISLATVYRTVKLFEDAGIIERHDFRDGRSRYEEIPDEHHDHLIDVKSGNVIEFVSPEIEVLQEEIARKLGYRLIDHRLELYAVPLEEE